MTTNDDNIDITIHAGRGILYRKNISNISDETDIDWLVDKIEYEYKEYIKDRFFY